jgi:hypothetical protein
MADEMDESFSGQPVPVKTDGPSMHDLVVEDMRARKEFGVRKYGTLLQAHNGRDALRDAYDEVLDLIVYLRQVIEERDTAIGTIVYEWDIVDGGILGAVIRCTDCIGRGCYVCSRSGVLHRPYRLFGDFIDTHRLVRQEVNRRDPQPIEPRPQGRTSEEEEG